METILASASPRRRELLRYIWPDYTVLPADIDETPPAGTAPEDVGEVTACRKAAHMAAMRPDALIVAADTVVLAGDEVLGKPADEADAARMLRLLSGTEHRVYTGVCVRLGALERRFTQCTRVWLYPLSPCEMEEYLATGEGADKAGAYGIQGCGCALVERIDGDYYNVMGLPLARLKREMKCILQEAGGPRA